jgi:2-C-methyl-D-erythritol 2,4-cyclodiphosphate synthase
VQTQAYEIINIDTTIVAQRPRLMPYIETMRENLARVLGCKKDQISVKATTTEGLGFEGEGRGISAHCVCCIKSKKD